MITLENDLTINMSQMASAKNLSDLWENESEAFKYGLNHNSVIKYLNNANIRKRNYNIYSELTALLVDTLDYRQKMQELIDEYLKDEEGSSIGLVNHVLDKLEYKVPEDKLRIAYVLGKYIRYSLKS